MFRRLRIAILLYVLLFVAAGHWLTQARSTDWDGTLWVTVHPVNGDGSAAAAEAVAAIDRTDFTAVESFFASEARRYGVRLEQPIRFDVAARSAVELPRLPADPSALDAVAFSLRLRWAAVKAGWSSDLPSADVTVFAVFHDGAADVALDRSVGLRKGMVAIANVFADRSAAGSNAVVIAHELLHTLGATDKYEPADNMPIFPDGYADPDARPLLPQRRAELMAGRIAVGRDEAVVPGSLRQVVVGPVTAGEIGWSAAGSSPSGTDISSP
ncbi:MAG: hypothetical protein JXB36_13390 [Gammaproteobacteria bacterium]|nr:hypothetical protein [Gammaproteobacteria bacterium]